MGSLILPLSAQFTIVGVTDFSTFRVRTASTMFLSQSR